MTDSICNSLRTVSPTELQQILKDHKLWIDSGGKEGKQANLCNVDLSDANLSGASVSSPWKIVDGKLTMENNSSSNNNHQAAPATETTEKAVNKSDDYDFAFKFDVAQKLIEALNIMPPNDRRDIITVLCQKNAIKLAQVQ